MQQFLLASFNEPIYVSFANRPVTRISLRLTPFNPLCRSCGIERKASKLYPKEGFLLSLVENIIYRDGGTASSSSVVKRLPSACNKNFRKNRGDYTVHRAHHSHPDDFTEDGAGTVATKENNSGRDRR